MEVVVKTGATSRAKLQSNHHHQKNNIQFWASSLSNSFNFPRYTTFDPVIIIFSFNMSKPFQPTLFDHQTDWFQS